MKHLLFLLFLSSCFCSIGQSITFLPDWKKGDARTYDIHTEKKEFMNDSLTEQQEEHRELKVSVAATDVNAITLKVLYDDVIWKLAEPLLMMVGAEAKAKRMELIYNVSRRTGEAQLVNWKEAKKFMDASFKEVKTAVKEHDKDLGSMMAVLFAPIEKVLESKENLEAYMKEDVGFLFVPFNRAFILGDTISDTSSTPNPFDPSQQISSTEHFVLRSLDEETGKAEIVHIIDVDFSQIMEMLKSMMRQMAKSFGADEATTEKKMKEADEINMEAVIQRVHEFDRNSSWVERSVGTAVIIGNDPSTGSRRNETTVTATAR